MEIKYYILPGVGLDNLNFGMDRDEVTRIIGEPDVTDIDKDNGFNSEMWIYSDKGITLFFEGDELPVLVSIESNNIETELFGEKVFNLTEQAIIFLLKANGVKELETEDENWGERRVSFDDIMIDFYFEKDKLNTVNWSMIIGDDDDDI